MKELREQAIKAMKESLYLDALLDANIPDVESTVSGDLKRSLTSVVFWLRIFIKSIPKEDKCL